MLHPIHYHSGKVTMNIAMARLYMKQGRSVIFATLDQQKTISMLSEHFNNALFELVDTWGVKVHERLSS